MKEAMQAILNDATIRSSNETEIRLAQEELYSPWADA
jgi:hypothetical protein